MPFGKPCTQAIVTLLIEGQKIVDTDKSQETQDRPQLTSPGAAEPCNRAARFTHCPK